MNLSPLSLTATLGALLLATATANAASPCKGLSETACASDTSCRWVAGYMRKDGREVAAYCRLGNPDAKDLGKVTADTKLSASE